METIEYRTVDKSGWAAGPWQVEPDKKQWLDAEAGLPCLIVRGPGGGLCGYVGVPADHPWHGKDYNACVEPARHDAHEGGEDGWHYSCTPGGILDAHGGITFASACSHDADESRHICHRPAPGEPDNVWWFGFDCAHSGDHTPKYDRWTRGDIYRDWRYVTQQVTNLAMQLAAIAKAQP